MHFPMERYVLVHFRKIDKINIVDGAVLRENTKNMLIIYQCKMQK